MYENNPRSNDEAVKYVANSIKKFGFKVPVIIDKNHTIIAGHTRFKAAKKLNIENLPCLIADDLDEKQIKAFRLADNKVSEFSDWNFELLNQELSKLVDFPMSDFGFESLENIDFVEDVIEDEVPEIPEEPKAKYGDIYKLGNHRLMCGDSTIFNDIEKLMNGNLANLLLTDPPYNVNYKSKSTNMKIKNDNQNEDSFYQFLYDSFSNVYNFLKDNASFYVWYASKEVVNFSNSLKNAGFDVKQELIWNKNSLVMSRCDYHYKHEPCLYGWKTSKKHNWYGDRKRTTVMDFDKPLKNDLHPTMKPVGLFNYQIQNSSKPKDIILDIFAGSGTTLMACEQNNRKAFLMELDPKYIDVIINRWEKFTGKKAEKL
jgi:site-specific DNA-methyltransferase (adenine-specific)